LAADALSSALSIQFTRTVQLGSADDFTALKNPDHASFVKEIAAADPPEHLNSLLNVLQARGSTQNITLPSPPFFYGSFPAVDPLRVHMYDLRLLKLYLSGEKIVSPGAKRGLIPVVVPLSESPAGSDVLWIE
jgi:hypothetical protein